MPYSEWKEENMSYAMCFFPWIGAVSGVVTYAVYALKTCLEGKGICFHELFWIVILVLIPVFITGGIHMDGFLDTEDALHSHQSKERKLEILKDSHTGAFAIISCVVYFIAYIGIYSSVSERSVRMIGISFMLSRTLSGLSVICFPQARKKGMAAEFSGNASKRNTRIVLFIYLILLGIWMITAGGIIGAAGVLTAGVVFAYYHHMCMAQFGGMTGDLAGYFLQLCEIAMAFVMVAADVILGGLGI